MSFSKKYFLGNKNSVLLKNESGGFIPDGFMLFNRSVF